MDNEILRAVVFEQFKKMRVMGLKGAPFLKDAEHEQLALETWIEALEDAGFNDAKAPTVAKCWRAMRRQAEDWFTPAALIRAVRSTYQPEQPALPNLTPEQCKDNLIRLEEMKAKAFGNG